MERNSILSQHNHALDRTMKNVMPDKWAGHGRLLIRDEGSPLSPAEQDKAIEHLNNLAEEKPELFEEHGAERVANKVISKLV